jgi:hypothetical protein
MRAPTGERISRKERHVQEISARLGPVAHQLLTYWAALPKRAGVPDRRDFDPMAIVRILPVVSLLQRVADDEWRFRIAGTEIERRWERRFTGVNYLAIDIVAPRAADMMRREFCRIVNWPCGSWSRRTVKFQSGRAAVIETLRLPLRADDGDISLILSCSEEFSSGITLQPDAPREIIQITQQQFLDIGAGVPDQSALDEPQEGESAAHSAGGVHQRARPSAPDGTS